MYTSGFLAEMQTPEPPEYKVRGLSHSTAALVIWRKK
jgi:hypothetical protein